MDHTDRWLKSAIKWLHFLSKECEVTPELIYLFNIVLLHLNILIDSLWMN